MSSLLSFIIIIVILSGAYWSGRFVLNDGQLPAFFTHEARAALLDCGKYLHVVRECGASPENPKATSAPLAFTTDARVLHAEISAARDWASKQVPRSRGDRAEIEGRGVESGARPHRQWHHQMAESPRLQPQSIARFFPR